MEELWRGSASAPQWAADGRLDVRSHLAKALEGLGVLAGALGLGAAFAPTAFARLRPYEVSVEILAPASAAEPLYGAGGVSAWRARAIRVDLEHFRAGDGAPVARVQIAARHVSARSGAPFPWPARVVETLGALMAQEPGDEAAAAPNGPGAARADALGMAATGRGVFLTSEADPAGKIAPDALLGRLLTALEDPAAAPACARLRLHALPEPGGVFVVRAGAAEGGGVTQWMLDAVTGRALAEAELTFGAA